MRRTRWLFLFAIVALVALAAPAGFGVRAPVARAATQQVRYNRFDVDLAIDPSGAFRVTETQEVAFISGTFQRASRKIDLSHAVDIRDVAVSEAGRNYTLTPSATSQAGTYAVGRSGDTLTIEWFFPATTGARRTFTIAYTVVGGLRINPDVDVLDWPALRPDLPADAAAATVTVHLPADVDRGKLQTDSRGAAATATVVDGRTVRFQSTGAVPVGKGLEVKVGFPHGLVSAAPPPWQAQFEQQQQAATRREAYRNLANLLLGALGLLIVVGGGIGLYLLWYLRGRDRYTGLVAEYLREPPSDLGPGSAGTLVDERADLQDVLATFTDLGRRGVLRITETQTPGVFGTGLGAGRDFVVERLESDAPLTAYERTMVETLFPGGATQVRLSEAKQRFTATLPAFQQQLYGEVVEKGYFTISPEATRRRYRTFGTVMIVLAIVGWFALNAMLGGFASWQILPALALFIVGLALRSLARAMPVKTEKGAEEAAKWHAFRRYLANLERYDNLAEAKGIFEQYLPYATAFGLDKGWIQKFASVDTPVPSWYGGYGGYGGGGPIIITGPGGYYGGGYNGGPGAGPGPAPGAGDGGGGGWSIPSLQDVSDRGGGGLQSASDSLMGMLDSAASVFSGGGGGGSDSGGGGGWSGGGGDSGGGGGGDSGGGGGDFG